MITTSPGPPGDRADSTRSSQTRQTPRKYPRLVDTNPWPVDPAPSIWEGSREVHLVQSDALAAPARRLPREVSVGVGRYSQLALRSAKGTRALQHLPRRARVCRGVRLRRDWRQRAPRQRVRTDALPQPHGGGPRAAHVAICAWWCWATPSRCTTRRFAWPKSSQCSTSFPEAACWPASRSARRWTPTTATARYRR